RGHDATSGQDPPALSPRGRPSRHRSFCPCPAKSPHLPPTLAWRALIDGLAEREVAALGIAHIREGRRILGKMTVLENLRLGAYLRRDAREVARSLAMVLRRPAA